jgi:hypothetical protein
MTQHVLAKPWGDLIAIVVAERDTQSFVAHSDDPNRDKRRPGMLAGELGIYESYLHSDLPPRDAARRMRDVAERASIP